MLKNKAVEEVLRVQREWNDAALRGDIATVDRILADDCTITNVGAHFRTKAQWMGDLKSGALKYYSISDADILVSIEGNTAVVTGRRTANRRLRGDDINRQDRFTRVFVKRQGRWQLLASQYTAIRPANQTEAVRVPLNREHLRISR